MGRLSLAVARLLYRAATLLAAGAMHSGDKATSVAARRYVKKMREI